MSGHDKSKMRDKIQKLLDRLSLEQRTATKLDSHAVRIVACAGSGKTETLTSRIIYLIHNGVDPASIVAFTFTDRAAQSMKSRLYKKTIEIGGLESRKVIAPMFLGTIHRYCLRLLQDYAGYDNYDVINEHRETAFVIEHGREIGLHELAMDILGRKISYSTAISIFLKSVSVVHNEMIPRDVLRRFSPQFNELLSKYETLLDHHKLFNFGQLISLSVISLENKDINELVANSISHLLIDEYQDLNPAQEQLVQLLISKGANLFVVGDSNQCIYQWRGSNVDCFEHFQEKFQSETSIMLSENRRSSPDIIHVANKVGYYIYKSEEQKMIPSKTHNGESVWWVETANPEEEAEWVTSKIIELNKSGIKFSDIAVLLRSVNTSGEPYIQNFKANKIPFVIGGRISLFRREEAQALGRIFAWLADESWLDDPHSRTWTHQTKYLLETALIDNWACSYDQYPHYRSQLDELKSSIGKNEYRNLNEIFRGVIKILGFTDLDASNPVDNSRLAIIGRFNQLIGDYESTIKRQDLSSDSSIRMSIKEMVRRFTWFLTSYAVSSYEEEAIEDKRELNAVLLTTVHQTKGLEWPIVFIPSLISRRFPSSRTGQRQDWLLHRGIFDVARYEGTMADERRLFYVALTRAKDGLYLSWFSRNKKTSADPSPFLYATFPEHLDASPENAGICEVPSSSSDEDPEVTTYSPSEIIWYRRCPYHYLLRKVWGFQPGIVRELGFGNALHHIMRIVGQEVQSGKKMNAVIARDIVEKQFYLPYAPPATAMAMKEAAAKKIARFVDNNIEDIQRIQQVEARLEFPVGSALIYGIVDVILRQDGKTVEVRDYKTTKTDPFIDDEADFQIKLYSSGLKQMGYPVETASIANLEEEIIRNVEVPNEGLSATVREALGYIDGIKSANYTAKLSRYCRRCDFSDICHYYT